MSIFSRLFAAGADLAEGRGLGKLRAKLAAGVEGVVVEVGAGAGHSLSHYGPQVSEVIAIEPDPYLRSVAAQRATERVRVVEGAAENLPVADGVADAVVFSLVLCSVNDQAAALAEAARVLRPGGRLHLLEHVVSPSNGLLRSVQRALDASVWPRMFGGCHCARDTVAAVEAAGFTWQVLEPRNYPERPRLPVSPHVYAVATRPS